MSGGTSAPMSKPRERANGSSAAERMRSRASAAVPGLVVLEARPRRLRDVLVGSTTARVVAGSSGPVLVLHRDRGAGSYTEAVVALDLRTDVGRLLEVTRSVAPAARTLYVHAYKGVYDTRMLLDGASSRELQRHLLDVRSEVHAVLSRRIEAAGGGIGALRLIHGGVRQVFLDEERARRGSDVLFVFGRRRSLLHDLVFGSLSGALIEEGKSDVLVV